MSDWLGGTWKRPSQTPRFLLFLLVGLLLFPAACHKDLDLAGFPCNEDSDCLSLGCVAGRCVANPEPTQPDGSEGPILPERPADGSPGDAPQPPERPSVPPFKPCFTGDASAKGVGVCKVGFLHPTTNVCEGQIIPARVEICDGLDNDCDGKIDNNSNCCRSKKAEECDGLDNDCDGEIDEDFPGKGDKCTSKSSNCVDGQKICYRGKVVCQSPQHIEKCGNSIDDNCDGVADQQGICGARHNFVSVYVRPGFNPGIQLTNNGKKGVRGFGLVSPSPSLSNYQYTLIKAPTSTSCEKRVLFVTARNNAKLSASYSCQGDDYLVSIRNDRLRPVPDSGFYAVQPGSGDERKEFWGRVDVSTCPDPNNPCRLKPTKSGGHYVHRVRGNVGHFRLKSGFCTQPSQPAFVAIYQKDANGFATIRSLGASECDILTFDKDGKPADRSFAVWIPNPKETIWATYAVDGSLVASQGNHPLMPWTLQVSKRSETVWYQVAHPTMSRATALLINTYSPALITGDIPTNSAPLRLHIRARDPYRPGDDIRKLVAFTVMFAH